MSIISKIPATLRKLFSFKKGVILIILAALITGIAYSVFTNIYGNTENDKAQNLQIDIETIEAKKGDVDLKIDIMGTISFKEKATISSKILGRVEKIYVEQGDIVPRGKPLAKIETLSLELDLKSARVDKRSALTAYKLSKEKLDRAKKNIEKHMVEIYKARIDYKDKYSSLENMKTILDKKKQLRKVGGISDSEIDSLNTKYTSYTASYLTSRKNYESSLIGFRNKDITSKGYKVPKNKKERKIILKKINTRIEAAEITAALDNLKKIKTQIEKLKINISEATIRSPISGVVAVRTIEIGERVKEDTDLFVIMNVKKIYLVANINEKELGKIKRNQEVSFTVDAISDSVFKGKVRVISPILDTATRTAEIKIEANNPKEILKPGMFARAVILTERLKGVIQVPANITRNEGDKDYLFLVKNGTAYKKEIIAGRKIGDNIEVVSGVKEGDVIASSSVKLLADGMKVNTQKLIGRIK